MNASPAGDEGIEEVVPDSPPLTHMMEAVPEGGERLIRVMALHALAYCERLFYLEEVEELRVANEEVYAGRALHAERESAGETGPEVRGLFVSSERLGLTGKVDAVRVRDGLLIPYEHKRGRARRPPGSPKGKPLAWPADALQVAAYGLLLEEVQGRPVAEGRIRYHADNVTVRVPLDAVLHEAVTTAVARARELRAALTRPPVTPDERKCARCSLAPVCLPEEERFTKSEVEEPSRLFPPRMERQTLHVLAAGTRVGRSNDRLTIVPRRSPAGARGAAGDAAPEAVSVPAREVGALVLHGYAQISTQALHLCAEQEVAVHWLTLGGRHIGALAAGSGGVQRRVRQYAALTDPGTALRLARRLALARIESQVRFLLRATRGEEGRRAAVEPALGLIREQLRAAARAEGVASLRGHEGAAGRAYFEALPWLLDESVSPTLRPTGRSRRPPRDPFNAALSFGYALLYRDVLAAILAVGLEPALGFMHTPRSSAQPLVLDLMELFRVPVWDMTLVASFNRRQWSIERDFSVAKDHVWLSEAGRRTAIELYERRLQDTWKHPVLGYSLEYRRLIELEVRLLEKEWSGSPGLFARSRPR